jgi:hypothetical protein
MFCADGGNDPQTREAGMGSIAAEDCRLQAFNPPYDGFDADVSSILESREPARGRALIWWLQDGPAQRDEYELLSHRPAGLPLIVLLPSANAIRRTLPLLSPIVDLYPRGDPSRAVPGHSGVPEAGAGDTAAVIDRRRDPVPDPARRVQPAVPGSPRATRQAATTTLRRLANAPSRVLPAGIQLAAHLADHARRQLDPMSLKKGSNRIRIPYRKRTQRPGQGLDHHGIAIVEQLRADCQRPRRIALSTLSAQVQWNRTHQGCSPPPAIRRASPFRDPAVRNPTHPPGTTGDAAGKCVNFTPAPDRTSQSLDIRPREAGQSQGVMQDHFVCDHVRARSTRSE